MSCCNPILCRHESRRGDVNSTNMRSAPQHFQFTDMGFTYRSLDFKLRSLTLLSALSLVPVAM